MMDKTCAKRPAVWAAGIAAIALALVMGFMMAPAFAANDEDGAPVSTNLAEAYLLFTDSDGISYYLDEGQSVTPVIEVQFYDGTVVPADAYDLTVKKMVGTDMQTGAEIYEDSAFPLTFDPKGSVDVNDMNTEGTAKYQITAVAKKGSGYKGQTSEYAGEVFVYDKHALTPYAGYVTYSSKYYNWIPGRYEFVKGHVPKKPTVMTDKTVSSNYFNVLYSNVQKDYKDPNKLPYGGFTVRVIGKDPYYGSNESVHIKIGKKNPIKVKAVKKVVKYKTLKKKAVTVKPYKVTKSKKCKDTVRYEVWGGNKRAQEAMYNQKIKFSEKTGKFKLKKGLKKGTYKIKVTVYATGITPKGKETNYIFGEKDLTVTIQVK